MSGHFPDDWFRSTGPDEAVDVPPVWSGTPEPPIAPAATPPDVRRPPSSPVARSFDDFARWDDDPARTKVRGGPPTGTDPGRTRARRDPAAASDPGRTRLRPESHPPQTRRREVHQPGAIPVISTAAGLQVGRVEADSTPPRQLPRRSLWSRFAVPLSVLALVLALALGLAIGMLVHQRVREATSRTVGPSAGSAVPSASASPAPQPWTGATAPLAATAVSAACTAPPAPAGDGTMITYQAANVLDSNPSTAWRCNGDGKSQTLTFTLPSGSTLVGVGLINGYAKVSGTTHLYGQFRRVLTVRWDLPNGTWFVQTLGDNNEQVQQVLIPPQSVKGPVKLTIVEVSAPGQASEPTRDAVLISTVQFWTKG